MAHTYCSNYLHCVFSTKERRNVIHADLRPKLWAFIGGMARRRNAQALAVGGTGDHVHILVSLPGTISVAAFVQQIKSGSSKWVHDTGAAPALEWQRGYGAFSIGVSQLADTVAYINAQERHHTKRDFQQEFVAFLKKHGIDYDPRYVWG